MYLCLDENLIFLDDVIVTALKFFWFITVYFPVPYCPFASFLILSHGRH